MTRTLLMIVAAWWGLDQLYVKTEHKKQFTLTLVILILLATLLCVASQQKISNVGN